MGWLWWLLAPMTVTVVAAVLTWWANRPRRAPTVEQAIVEHRQFLRDLARYSPATKPEPSRDLERRESAA